tara:strand:- start:61 stop:828 length:768 start_codon:yes stop_codon:yes gene_type:complete
MSYVVAIPSYDRSVEINKKTLATLQRGQVSPSKIYVFVANKDELAKYKETMDPATYNKLVVGVIGITPQRAFISNYFAEGKQIVEMDDDVRDLLKISSTHTPGTYEKLQPVKNLDKFFKDAFKQLKESKLKLWGIFPVHYVKQMKNNTSTDLRFIIGVTYGFINRRKIANAVKDEVKGDIELTILTYLEDGGVLRFNNIAPKTVFNAPGGLGPDRKKRAKESQEYLIKTYPNIASAKFRKDGTPEIRLKRNPVLD